MAASKLEMVTLKVDREMAYALKALPNRSEFIRRAMLKALANECPLCQGTGMLSVAQRRHWERFAERHPLVRCEACDAYHLSCRRERVHAGGEQGHGRQERAAGAGPATTGNDLKTKTKRGAAR